MADRGASMRERMKARRERMKGTGTLLDDDPLESPKDGGNLNSAMEDGMNSTDNALTEDEAKEAKELVTTLTKKRKKKKRELDEELRRSDKEDDPETELKSAKQKTKQKVMEEAAKSATEGEETADETITIPKLDTKFVDSDSEEQSKKADVTPSSTARSTIRTPRRQSSEEGASTTGTTTPRKLKSALGKSYKEKLREKMRAVKDQGKDEAYDETRKTGRIKGQRSGPVATRFDDPAVMRQVDIDAEETLDKSIAIRKKWKETTEKAAKPHMPSVDESYDFFTRQWESEDEEDSATKPAEAPKPKEETEEDGEDGEPKPEGDDAEAAAKAEAEEEAAKKKKGKKKKKRSKERDVERGEEEEPLLDEDDDDEVDAWKYYQVGRAEYKPMREKMLDEQERYFVPSIIEAPIQDKIFEQQEPRNLEDEGFYVGQKPNVPMTNLHKFENRLLREDGQGRDWFGEDGTLIHLPDPLKEIPSRPVVLEEGIDPNLETEYAKAFMNEFDSRFIDGNVEAHGLYRLDVDVNTITFSHHHLFSREHVLASRITELYDQYAKRCKRKTAEYLTEKLKALKSAAAHVQDQIERLKSEKKAKQNKDMINDHFNRLKDYKYEVRVTRKQRDSELRADRNLGKHILNTWKEIKSLRSFQGYTNTSVKLTIQKEPMDKGRDTQEWEREIEDEIGEMQEDVEDEYHRQEEEYKEKLEKWKKQKLERKEAQKRKKERKQKKKRRLRTLDGEEEELENIEEEDEEAALIDEKILEEEAFEKPEKPKMLSDTEARDKILARFEEIRRKPGEPLLMFEVGSGSTVTPASACPRGEQQRRNDVDRYKLSVKVLFNNKVVCQTGGKPLGQNFEVPFGKIFNIEIVQWPESIKIQVYENTALSSTMLCEVYAGIPESNITADTVQLDEIEFSSDQRESHSHEGVGSGTSFSFESDGSNMMSLMTTGVLSSSAAWGVDKDGNVLVPPTNDRAPGFYSALRGMDAVAGLGMAAMADMDKLTKWISDSRLDPNDPQNAHLMHLMKPVGGDMRLPEHFRLEQLQQEFNLCQDDDLDKSRRYQMLQLRDRDVDEFKNKMVPGFDKEIPEEAFDEYEKHKKEEEKIKKMDDMESHRAAVAKFMQRVREQVMLRYKIATKQKTLADMVSEEAVPNISTIIPNLAKLAEPRRPLKPVRKERKLVTAQNLQGQDVKVLVNVVRAFDIPVRAEALQKPAQGQGQRSGNFQGQGTGGATVKNIAGEVLVRPYIECMFQRNTISTSVAEGPNPSWNEELRLPFRAPNNDYSATKLQTIGDVLYLNLFDEYVIDTLQDDKDKSSGVYRRIEKKWLGSIKIPFTTIYFNGRIDGTFRIDKPPVLLGYTYDTSNTRTDTGIDIGVGTGEHTYLTMFVTIEPGLSQAEPAKEKFDSNEDPKLLQAAYTWQADLEKKFTKREFKTTVVDINGKSVFITRFFKGLKPPDELLQGEAKSLAQCEAVARFVSLIPFVSDSVVFPGLCDIWSTCDQFLQMLQGDEEEHAVLLANFFIHMGKKVWLLIGTAIPEGSTAYVVTEEDNRTYKIWNASTGEWFDYRDNYCPVTSVGCLVNADNIWANIQPYDQASRISFDLHSGNCWKPFFGKSFPHPGIGTVQPEALIYIPTDKNYVVELQEKIERHLKEKLMEWRPRHITRWNRYCVQAFRKLLLKLEEVRGKGMQSEHSQELEQVLGSYKDAFRRYELTGFPINMPYTSMEPIVDAVYSTGVHNQESSDIEFALAVHIHPYPNTVMSVWVYVASLVRKR